jgi:hypothetical protein
MVWLQRYIADLGRAWPVLVVCGGIAPLLLSVTWLILVRYFVGVITWLTIILLNVFTLLVTLFFYIKGMTKALWFPPPFWCLIEFKVYCFKVCNSIQLWSHVCWDRYLMPWWDVVIWAAGWIGKDAVTAVVGSGANNVLSSSTTVSTSPFTDESQSFMLEHLVWRYLPIHPCISSRCCMLGWCD